MNMNLSIRRYSIIFLIFFIIITLSCMKSSALPADWMSGNHGIGLRVPGGVNFESCLYNVDHIVQQITTHLPEISWVLIGLSSGAYGDRYLSPHSILTNLNRASTPRQTQNVEGKPDYWSLGGVVDFDLESYPERDLFAEIVEGFHAVNIKVIAYMAAQGPTFLKHDETWAYDYNNLSPFVNSTAECELITNGVITDGKCSPSARKWASYVKEQYGSDDTTTMKTAYAELIVAEYAQKFDGTNGPLIDGWWFDQGDWMNIPLVHSIIKSNNPDAVIAFNRGQKAPLINNNPPYEDYTFGHPNPVVQTSPDDPINEPMITSAEQSSNGYLIRTGDYGTAYSLAHVFLMTNNKWNNGSIVWNTPEKKLHAADWMRRVVEAGGAWTWNVKRSFYPTRLHDEDVALLKEIYALVKAETPSANPSVLPSSTPSLLPSTAPSTSPTYEPSVIPSVSPSRTPSSSPTYKPSTSSPPSNAPTPPKVTVVQIKNKILGNWCMTAKSSYIGAIMLTKKCNDSNLLQRFIIDNDTGLIHLQKNTNLCIRKRKWNLVLAKCNNTDLFRWTITDNGRISWTKSKYNNNVSIAGDKADFGKPLKLTKYLNSAKTMRWSIVVKED